MPSLRRFPYGRLTARRGTIGGFLFENRHADVPRSLFHAITVPLEPFVVVDLEGKKKKTRTDLRLEFIELPDRPFRGYRALVGQTFEFPSNPEPGFIDGSIYLNDAHNMLDVSELSFLALRRGLLDVRITLAIDFESEQTGYANSDALAVEVELRPEPIRIDSDIVIKAKRRSPRELLAPFVDTAILGDTVIDGDCVSVRLCKA